MITFDEAAKRRIRFLTRRGLLELDIVLKRFMEKEFPHLSDEELAVFVEILDLPDQEFLALVNRKETTENPEFANLLDKIRQS
ncbi:succinate dehydrogenase assembly factor 2 [Neisseria sp. 23W00296]|uniref:FAD assembly factor SdhE n=1 Tax=unclassified Neisseria TaxID=2623750 RepID=UPI0002A1A194|nr:MULTISPECIES: succinate dehydrogenase assembly factor 2 [unclassified Neisseria]ASP17423.1 succinate dehydrogenase assembly factor 2 family protein [Neisseria sp. KEM232]EKY06894.1 TPR repeat region [Neisseria sp. oral taxon 020 str. F0370]